MGPRKMIYGERITLTTKEGQMMETLRQNSLKKRILPESITVPPRIICL